MPIEYNQIKSMGLCNLPRMRWHRSTIVIPLIVMVSALIARVYGLADKPFWLDEVTTQRRLNLPISDLFADSFLYGQFPTYFALVRALNMPIIDEWTLRLPSAIFGAISVLLVTLIATEIRSPRAGLVAGVLMA